MPHPLVTQLHFARTEFVRCLDGVSEEDGARRLEPMNSIGWIVGHVAAQEQFFWVEVAQGRVVVPGLGDLVGFGRPASTPPLGEMWAAWKEITVAADDYLDTLSDEGLDRHLEWQGEKMREPIGHWLLRNVYHYWFHTGEAHAIRQSLGHPDLPQFVGNLSVVEYSTRQL